jgi:hypothetical protein
MMKRNGQFDLLAMLEWTAVCAFVFALFAGSGGKVSWTVDFTTLPPNDVALRQWLDQNRHARIELTRSDLSVTLVHRTGWSSVFTNDIGFSSIPHPPWKQLGYGVQTGIRGSNSWQMFSGSMYLWLAGFAILIGLGIFRRRWVRNPVTRSGDRE